MSRPAMSLLLLLACSNLLASQALTVTATAAGERVRFVAPGTTCQIRVRILSASGATLVDTDWKDGNVFDWAVDRALASDYRCIVMTRDLDGQVSEVQATITSDSNSPRITFLAHDEEKGAIVTTTGDLTFRFGNYLAGADAEKMRLTADGELDVNGLIRASKGIMFADGTILTSASAFPQIENRPTEPGSPSMPNPPARSVSRPTPAPIMHSRPPIDAESVFTKRLTPRPNFAPAYQFLVGDMGVNVGTTNPAYNLDVTGHINTNTEYEIGAVRFAHRTGSNNAFLGINAGNVTLTGTQNTAIGVNTLTLLTIGGGNTAAGYASLHANDAGCCNVADGAFTLNHNTGSYNTAVGSQAMQSNVGAAENVAIGDSALFTDTAGGNNTAVGAFALYNATGFSNTALGYLAGNNIMTGSDNIDIGNEGATADAATIRIGTAGQHTSAFIAGIVGTTTGNRDAVPVVIDSAGQLGTISSSRRFKFDIADMAGATERLMQLRPVTFRYLAHGDNAPVQYGLIAEEVAGVYPEMVVHDKQGEPETVLYQFLAPMLLNELQKEHRRNEEQQRTIDDLLKRIEALERARSSSAGSASSDRAR